MANKEWKKSHYDANKEYYRRKNREYYAANKERRKDYMRTYTAENRERLKAYRESRREHARDTEYKRVYGLTRNQYDEKLANQDCKCAICQEIFEDVPHVDHCHKTGRVRGLLCERCNHMVGNARDSICNLWNAIAYLQYHHWEED